MPTTLTGLLLFVVLLLPGFTYQVGKERSGAERRPPPFRETVSIVAASVISELVIVAVTWPLWSRVLDTRRLTSGLGSYWRDQPGLLAGCALALLVLACGLAFAATQPRIRGWWPMRKVLGKYPHESTMSAWWRLFEEWQPDIPPDRRYVGCVLEDGSFIAGYFGSFNRSADDLPDRDLILVEPIKYRDKDVKEIRDYPAHAVCVSARRMVVMFVTYVDPSPDV